LNKSKFIIYKCNISVYYLLDYIQWFFISYFSFKFSDSNIIFWLYICCWFVSLHYFHQQP